MKLLKCSKAFIIFYFPKTFLHSQFFAIFVKAFKSESACVKPEKLYRISFMNENAGLRVGELSTTI